MGLVNLFNAIAMRPHIPYRFRGEIWPNSMPTPERDDKSFYPMEFTIKRISQPVFKLDTENKIHFGNTAYVVPILKFGETTMEITFEETDNMRVFKMLSGFLGGDVYKGVYGGLINIRVTQYDETMTTITDKKVYVCRLQEHGMPQFNNNGFGSPVEISATFNVIYVMEEPLTLEGSTDDHLPTIVHEALPDNEYLTSELAKVAEEEQKQQKKTPDKPNTGRRTPEMEKRTQEAQENLQKKSDELSKATNNLLDVYYVQNQDAVDKYLNDSNSELSQNAWKNFANERAKQFGTGKDASTLTPEERAKLEEEWKHMKSRDKFKYGTGIDAADGLDDTEIDLMYKLIGGIDDEAMQADYNERLSGILDKNTEYNNAKAEYEEARNESLPPNSGYNGNDPLLGAVSSSYEKEVTAKEGERGHVFFDMLDAGGARGTINLGSGSSEGARGYSDIGEITVNINGVTMKFKDSASLNAAVQKAFGGKEAIVDVFLENGGGKGYTTKEERKKADLKGAKEGLNKLLEATGGVITDDYGNTSVVKLDKGKGIYLNIQLDEDSSQRVSDKNMALDTKGWSESTKQTVIDSNDSSANKTVQGMLHFEHAYSGFKSVWNQFNKDESNVQMLNEDIKRGTFSQATLDKLSRSVDKLKVSEKTKASFKRVIKEYGYLT